MVGMRVLLDQNDERLMDLAQSVVNGIRERINANAVLLGRTESRIRASINGHLRKNIGILKPIVQHITEGIANAVDNVQVHVNSLAYRPDVNKWLTEFPPNPAWGGIVPRVPLTEEVKAALDPPPPPSGNLPPLPGLGAPPSPGPSGGGGGPGRLPPAPPGCHWLLPPPGSLLPAKLICPPGTKVPGVPLSPPPGQPPPSPGGAPPPSSEPPPSPPPPPATMLLAVLYHCQLGEIAGVPNMTGELLAQLNAEGWQLYAPAEYITCQDVVTCTEELQRLAPYAAQICHQGP